MDRHLIPYLQVAIDILNNTISSSVTDLRVQEYSFSFRQCIDHCDVTVFFDSKSGCVCMNQVYTGDNDYQDDDDISLDSFIKYIS
jgi:hypothetical protein